MMWPTEYMELKRIDELLVCGICYEYMDTSVMTSCSHNYCSLCIRKYLHYKTQCPACSEETFEKDLRKNKVLDEIIIYFVNVKEKFQKEFYQEETKIVKDENFTTECSSNDSECRRKIDVYDADSVLHTDSNNTACRTSVSTSPNQRNCHQDISSPSTSISSKVASIFTPKSKRNFQKDENCNIVVCPVCKVHVPQNNINKHLDDCLKREDTKHQPRKTESKRKPLPKLVLSLMKDSEIRKKLKELGLTSQGDRKSLESRLQRYIILYNAECDKINPRPVPELIKQCEEEENLEKKAQKSSNVNRLNVNRNTEHNIIEEQRKRYLAANKDSFKQLVAKMKKDDLQKLPVRRNILKKEKLEVLNKNIVDDFTTRDSERSNFLPMDSTNFYTNDSDSNASCPLQMYSSENPLNFLTIELSSSSDGDSNQSILTSNRNSPSLLRKINSASSNPNVETGNIQTELLFCESVIHKEVASGNLSSDTKNIFPMRGCNILEDEIDINNEQSLSERTRVESKGKREATFATRRDTHDTKYSQEKRIAHSLASDGSDKDLHNKAIDSSKDIKYDITDMDSIENQLDYETLKEERLHNAKEGYTSDNIKLDKKNVESDENINLYVLRKRERNIVFTLSDEEKTDDRSINGKKLARFGLSEAKGFNNENIGENALQNEEKLQRENEHMRTTYARRTNNAAKRLVKSRGKVNKSARNSNTR